METFVRSLIEARQGATGALAGVIDEVVSGLSRCSIDVQAQPGYVDGLVRGAMLREAIATLTSVGELPLVMGDALWAASLDPSPLDRGCRSLALLVGEGRVPRAIEALTARGFSLHRDHEADWFSLEGLPSLLCVRERLRDPIAPFRLRHDGLRQRAELDERSFGATAWRPSAEDGLCAWAIDAGESLLHGRSPHWQDAAVWQQRFPSEPETLCERAREHGVARLLPVALIAAHDVTGDAALSKLASHLGSSRATDLAARLSLRSFDGSVADRRLGAMVIYSLAPDLAAARHALTERALKVVARVVSKL